MLAANSLQKKIQYQAFRIVYWQMAGVLVFALLALSIRGLMSGFAVLAGGVAYGLPTFLFAWLIFRFVGAQQVAQFMTAFFLGEMIKLILAAMLFIVIVKYLPVSLLSVLIGFIGAIVSFWVACMWLFSIEVKRTSS